MAELHWMNSLYHLLRWKIDWIGQAGETGMDIQNVKNG